MRKRENFLRLSVDRQTYIYIYIYIYISYIYTHTHPNIRSDRRCEGSWAANNCQLCPVTKSVNLVIKRVGSSYGGLKFLRYGAKTCRSKGYRFRKLKTA